MGMHRVAAGILVAIAGVTLSAPAAAQQVRRYKIAWEDYRSGDAWPWRGDLSLWDVGDDAPSPPPAPGSPPAAALYVTAGFQWILVDFSLTPGERPHLDGARSDAIDMAEGMPAMRAATRAVRAAIRLSGSEAVRAEARQELLVSGLLGRLGLELLRRPEDCAKASLRMAGNLGSRYEDPALPPRAIAATRHAERSFGLAFAAVDRRALEGISGAVLDLSKEMDEGRHHRRHLSALTQALAAFKAKRPTLVLCIATNLVSTEAALEVRSACDGVTCTYGVDLGNLDEAPGTPRRAAIALPFEFQDDKAWSAAGGPILQVRIDPDPKAYRFTLAGVAAATPDVAGLQALVVAKIPEAGCAVVRMDAPWHALPWGDFLNIVQTLSARKCGRVVCKRAPPREAAAPPAKGAEKPGAPPAGLDALRKSHPDVVARLVTALADLRSADPGRIAAGLAACEGCTGVGAPLVPPVLPLLADGNTYVRAGAIAVLAANPDPGAMAPLARALRDASTMVRARAAEVLVDMGDAGAIPGLLEALADADPLTRELAASVLEAIPDPRAAEPLAKLVDDRQLAVRVHALMALAAAAGEAAEPRLVKALADTAPWVRGAARAGLVARRSPAALEALAARVSARGVEDDEAAAIAGLLARFGAGAVPTLIRLLTDPREAVRRAVAFDLSEFRGDATHVPLLVAAVRGIAPDVDAKPLCDAIGEFGVIAVAPLLEVLREGSDHARRAAARALMEIRDPAVIPPLCSVLRMQPPWSNGDINREALNALGALGDVAVDPLIELMGQVPREGAEEIAMHLSILTREPTLGPDPAAWRKWRAAGGKARARRSAEEEPEDPGPVPKPGGN